MRGIKPGLYAEGNLSMRLGCACQSDSIALRERGCLARRNEVRWFSPAQGDLY